MNYYLIIRGPLGVGKSTVSRRLARALRAEYISIDRVLEESGLWYSGRLAEFLRVNVVVAKRALRVLQRGGSVVLDGNFYWKSQIQDLERRLGYRHFVFTLAAPLDLCIVRDAGRAVPHGSQATKTVYARSTRFTYGIRIDATRPPEQIVSAIRATISPEGKRSRRTKR